MAELIDSITNLIKALVGILGPLPTVIVVSIYCVVSILFKIYQIKKKDEETNKALDLAEEAVQRLAKENREWKILFFKENYNWSDEQIKSFLIEGDFKNAVSTRKILEKDTKR